MVTIATVLCCAHCNHLVHNGPCQTVTGHGEDVGGCGCKHYLVKVQTKPCICCHETGLITVDYAQYIKWQEGMLVQQAFPDLSASEREMLITGTHPKCWDKMFGKEEE